MRWYTIVLAILLLLGLTLMLRFGVRLTSHAGRTSLALQVGGISVLRLPLGERRPPKVGRRKKKKKEISAVTQLRPIQQLIAGLHAFKSGYP